MRAAAKGKTRTPEPTLGRRGALGRRRPRGRQLASGHINFSPTSHRGVKRRKSKKALGIEREVRRNRVGSLFHRWYEAGMGRYNRKDPLGLAGGGRNLFSYVNGRPVLLVDPTGLQSSLISPRDLVDEVDRGCAIGAFGRNFADMRRSNWQLSDSCFHCKANRKAAQCGPPGEESSCVLGNLRELTDRLFKDDTPFEIASDQSANSFGRQQGSKNQNTSCKTLSADYRPLGLPAEF